MKILLINPPQYYNNKNTAQIVPPLGLMYLGAVLKKEGFDVNLIDTIVEAPECTTELKRGYIYRGMKIEDISKIVTDDIEIIGISNMFSMAFPIVLALAQQIKAEHPDAFVVLGGAHPSATPTETAENKEIDYVIISEGEVSFTELCKALEKKDYSAIRDIDGIVFRDGETIKMNPKTRFIKDLDTLPFPDRDLLDLNKYYNLHAAHGPVQDRYTPIISSRGCPFRCTFCTPKIWNFKYRGRFAHNVVDEIEHCVKKYNITEFHFEDENLTMNARRILDICEEITRRNLNIKWQTPNGIRASVTNEEILTTMKNSGCYHITVAPESGSKHVLEDIMNKQQDLEKVSSIVTAASKLDLYTAGFFIVGLPGEKIEDIELTINYAKELAKKGLDEIYLGSFVPLPGSELYDKLKAEGKIPQYWDALGSAGDLEHSVSWSVFVSDEKLRSLMKKGYVSFHLTKLLYHPLKVLKSVFNIIRMRETLKTEKVIISYMKQLLRIKNFNRLCK